MNVPDLLISLLFGLSTVFMYRFYINHKKASKHSLHEEYIDGLTISLDEKIKKQWLISFYMITVISILFNPFMQMNEKLLEDSNFFSVYTTIFFWAFLETIPWFGITYYCSYKKRGTAWLMVTALTIYPLAVLLTPLFVLNELIEVNQFSWISLVIPLGFQIFYWMNSLNLYRANLIYKFRSGLNEESKQCILDLCKSDNLEDLKSLLNYAVSHWPQMEKYFSKIYKRRKRFLENKT